jgi:hypothetical protein
MFRKELGRRRSADTPAIGGEVPDGRESLHVAGLQENGARQDGPDAGNGLQQRITGLRPPRLPDPVLDRANLVFSTAARIRANSLRRLGAT